MGFPSEWWSDDVPWPDDLLPPTDTPPDSVWPRTHRRRPRQVGFVIEQDGDSAFALLYGTGEVVQGLTWESIASEEVGFARWADASALREAAMRTRDVHELEGIGATHAARLAAAGVTSIADLANVDLKATKMDGVSAFRMKRWRAMAKLSLDYPELGGNDVEILAEMGIESRRALDRRDAEPTRQDVDRALERVRLPASYSASRVMRILGLGPN